MNPYLLPVIEFGPLVISRLLEQFPKSRLDEPTGPDRFTVRETIAHLADWEPILLGRLRTAQQDPGSLVQGIDEGQRAIDQNYAGTDPDEQVRLFVERRHETAQFLRGLPAEDWQKSIVHQERGTMTIRDQAQMLIGHDLYHIEQITGLLAPKTAATW